MGAQPLNLVYTHVKSFSRHGIANIAPFSLCAYLLSFSSSAAISCLVSGGCASFLKKYCFLFAMP